jgi:cytochrome c peroxidase
MHTSKRVPTAIGLGGQLILGLILTLSGCERSLAPDDTTITQQGETLSVDAMDLQSALDQSLLETVRARSETGQIDFFKFPESTQLERIPQDPNNPLTRTKVELGRRLYHETALAVSSVRPEGFESYSCASCHHAQGGFAANLPQGMAEGGSGFGIAGEGRVALPDYDSSPDAPDCQPIRTPSTLNGAYQELMLWNGQFGGVGDNLGTVDLWLPGTPLESNHLGLHGLETQAHAGLVVHRMASIELSRVATSPTYQALFRVAYPFERQPVNRLNAALAIAAYERTLLATRSPFQRWLKGNVNALTVPEKRGALLFFGNAGCVSCHTGPALNSMSFHALGMYDLDHSCDLGRVDMRPFEGTVPEAVRRGRGGFTGEPTEMYAFKTPQLYNLVDSPFYGHGASFASVREVVVYKNLAVAQNPIVPPDRLADEFVPLGLTAAEIDDLVAFVERGLYDPDLERYLPNRLPTGLCFPNNDAQSILDLGCRKVPPGHLRNEGVIP